ncbi:MAG: hypothetical protein H0U84_00180 [Thermoleophilaceae bacterium]|nr:hypothetical protein [Thermoleophilaceae bacterium]
MTDRETLALARLEQAERELGLVRHQQDAKIAELEERLGWFEENELDFREAVEKRPWLGTCLGVWGRSVKLVRRVSRRLSR